MTEQLIQGLYASEKEARARAGWELIRVGSPAVEGLLTCLSDDIWVVRYRAAEALGEIGDGRSCEPLTAALADPKDHVRYMAAKSLGKMGTSAAKEQLVPLLHDENEYVRRITAQSLGLVGDGAEIAVLQAARAGETDPEVCAAIDDAVALLQKKNKIC